MKGRDAEQAALDFLIRHQLVLLARNYRCRFGEIDLIMQDGETVVFIEVRLRSSERFGGAAVSITTSKQAKLLTTARYYLAQLHHEPPCRFDAVLLSDRSDPPVEWIKNAFGE